MKNIPKAFEPEKFEERIYHEWEESGYFKPEINKDKKKGKFVMMMPPPNVTGKLHIGHSLVLTIEDLMARYYRLIGDRTLWLPGMDHAGIATQAVVDKALRKEGVNKNELGREKFVEKVWEWKEKYGGIILKQTRKMGASCDWSRERFTLDEGLSKAVNEAFVELYNRGMIYRGEYIVNWCPRCQTAISDDEVEHETRNSKLYYFKYDKSFPITIATTRPETKLGDTAVAVNPNDKRYKQYIGKSFDINIDGVKRTIRVISDKSIDTEFGTGAVGVTPAHSQTDWRIGEANKLITIKVINEYGKMTDKTGKYEGMKVGDAAAKLIEYLKNENLLDKEENYTNNVAVCYRCGSNIEPLPSKQWFVSMKSMAEKASQKVRAGEIEIIPKRFEKVYFHWMDNIRDWCVSRQLWWGHRIPVWYRKEFKVESSKLKDLESTTLNSQHPTPNSQLRDIYVGMEPPKDIENWEQDPDVLDTWFSSSLWPFSTLGWPEETTDFKEYFPTTVLETGHDILPIWVAKMIMMSLELTGKIPFEKVYLHGMVRDEQNRKMSKSLGNALDPLELIPKYGTDALRMALVVGSTPGQDMALGESKIRGYRNFSNKIWNASRFVMLRVSEGDLQNGSLGEVRISDLDIDRNKLTNADKEILKLHKDTIVYVGGKIKDFKFSLAGEEIYDYFWHKFCDIYIERAKLQIDDKATAINTKKVLIKILSESLIILHPFVPFVTEAVWQELRNICPVLEESIMVAGWPESN